jgi:hypothetical protein
VHTTFECKINEEIAHRLMFFYAFTWEFPFSKYIMGDSTNYPRTYISAGSFISNHS